MPQNCLVVFILSLLGSFFSPVNAFWRMSCPSRLMDERIDPLIAPGAPSGHVHTVAGGNGMNFTLDYHLARQSTCSSCPIKEDLSNYWTPKLYYHNTVNDTFSMVPQAGDGNGMLGGMTVYYLQRPGPNNDKLHAFPAGFRMIAGNPFVRNYTGTFAAQAISFTCLNYNGPALQQTNNLPPYNCPDGVRAQVFFPSCWDGVHLYLPDQSHMSYPETGAYNDGTCPSSHPVHMISLFYEVIYQTNLFVDAWHGSEQPFVFAMGDPLGFGFHGDFVNGWNIDTLQKAVDDCNNLSGLTTDCSHFNFFSDEECQQCTIPPRIHEDVQGPLSKLPGCNPIQRGPGYATNFAEGCKRAGKIGPYERYYTDMTKTLGWKYLGCGPDNVADRTFSTPLAWNTTETLEKCIEYCANQGYSIAGAEYGDQCFCGVSIPADRQPVAGVLGTCDMPCAGNKAQYCGGAAGLSLYQKCTQNGPCVNQQYHHVQ